MKAGGGMGGGSPVKQCCPQELTAGVITQEGPEGAQASQHSSTDGGGNLMALLTVGEEGEEASSLWGCSHCAPMFHHMFHHKRKDNAKYTQWVIKKKNTKDMKRGTTYQGREGE